MIVLYDQSAATGALVIGTSNKTEFLLGYTTMFETTRRPSSRRTFHKT